MAAKLDFEREPEYNIVVRASDSAFESRSDSTRVQIVLQDVDDNEPKFESDSMEAEIKENSPAGTLVTTLR